VHGGGWSAGKRTDFAWAASRLARSGYVAATIDYRLVPEGTFPHAPQDVACALAFLRLHAGDYRLDPQRVVMMGYSAGGHLVGLVALAHDDPGLAPDCVAAQADGAPSAPQGVISAAGPMDLRTMSGQSAVQSFVGGTIDRVPERWDEASPAHFVHPGEPPFLFIQGQADWLVDPAQMRAMRDAMRAAGNDAELLELVGGGHLLNPDPALDGLDLQTIYDTPEAWTAIGDFLVRTVGKP
jgi:acetyl esterase/lipase